MFHYCSPLTEFRWNTSEWSECTRTCGGGSRNRSVVCLNVSIPISNLYRALLNNKVETEVNETMCRMFERAGEKPTSRELCNTDLCPIWHIEEEYSEVSKPHSRVQEIYKSYRDILISHTLHFSCSCHAVQCDMWHRSGREKSHM